jgi:CHAT domain-containing protein
LFDGVELLTLSACETALSSDADGRDFEGFAALAQRAGVGAVMASLWAVSDDSTAKLMGRFYENRGASPKMSKSEALRQAQLAMIRGELIGSTSGATKSSATTTKRTAEAPTYPSGLPSYSHPYYWAPFVLIGNPR